MKILAIESSCDETAAAVVEGGRSWELSSQSVQVVSNVVASQIDIHQLTGGVVPEVASRAHVEKIVGVVDKALLDAKAKPSQIDAIAVTAYPGLTGALLVGATAAKSLALAWDKPLIPVNHLEGHIYANFIQNADKRGSHADLRGNKKFLPISNFQFPAIILLVSGGHTSLVLMKGHGKYVTLGETLDDAAGEAFDKVAKILDLGYPGGPAVSQQADVWREKIKNKRLKIKNGSVATSLSCRRAGKTQNFFPRPMIDSGDFDFSFSGLKTAVLYKWQKEERKNVREQERKNKKEEFAFEAEEAIVDVLVAKTIAAAKKHKAKTVSICGGVSANRRLRDRLGDEVAKLLPDTCYLIPEFKYCTDNAAMIASCALYKINNKSDILRLNNLSFAIDSTKRLGDR